jgi:hypothetical protein
MGFSNQERINTNTAALQATTLDGNASAVWYEKIFNFQFALPSTRVWTQFSSIPQAVDLATAQTNATNNPTIISDLSAVANAKRLTEIPGTNDTTYAVYSTYNDFSTALEGNWIQPQQIPQTTGVQIGQPSFGYNVTLYNGDPNAGGTVVSPSAGTTGTGESKTVGWIFNYTLGLLLLSGDFFTETGINAATFNPYVTGFRYIGTTAGSGSGSSDKVTQSFTCDETIATGDLVRLVSSSDAPAFTNPGRIIKSIATTATSGDFETLGVADTSGSAGSSIAVVLFGVHTLNFGSTPTNADIGKDVYLSDTVDGQATLTAPTSTGRAVVRVGKLLTADGSNSVNCKIDIDLIAILS